MKSKYKLSIIVPVYNSVHFLPELLNSINSHFYKNKVELLMIDDGSTDGSLDIEQSFDNKKTTTIDSKVIQVSHNGASNARNIGIENADGEYILFCDADDIISQQIDDIVDKAINEKIDIVSIEKSVSSKHNERIMHGSAISYEIMQAMFGSVSTNIKSYEYGIGPVCKLFRRELLLKHNVKFPTKVVWWEDSLFNIQALKYSNKFKLVKRDFYQVRINGDSVSHQVDSSIIDNANRVLDLSNYYLKGIPSAIKDKIYNQQRAFILWELFGRFFIYNPQKNLFNRLNDFKSLNGLHHFAPNLQSKMLIISLNRFGFYITVNWYKIAKLLKDKFIG